MLHETTLALVFSVTFYLSIVSENRDAIDGHSINGGLLWKASDRRLTFVCCFHRRL